MRQSSRAKRPRKWLSRTWQAIGLMKDFQGFTIPRSANVLSRIKSQADLPSRDLFLSSAFNTSAMEMDFYKGNFAAFALLNAVLAFREYRQVDAPQEKDDESRAEAEGKRVVLDKFKWNFIPIYLLVNGADWLQVRKFFGFLRVWN
jgi:hypothetical protein